MIITATLSNSLRITGIRLSYITYFFLYMPKSVWSTWYTGYTYIGGGVQFLVIIPTHCDTLSITGIRLWYIIYYCMTHTIWLPWYTGYTYFGRGGCPNFSHHPYTLRYTLKNGYTSMVNPLFLLLYESYFLVALVYGVYVFWGGVPILVIPAKHWDSLRIRGIRL